MKILISKKTGIFYYYIKDDFHCKEGMILKEELNSDKHLVLSNTKREFLVFDANNYDEKQKLKRGPQIILPKDLGYIASRTGITKNSFIIEAGGGSGAATIFFAQIAKKVHTYEIVEDHFKLIEKNLKIMQIENVKVILGDLKEYIETEEKDVDMLFLDMPEPLIILEKNLSVLKSGSYIVCYIPSISQVQTISNYLKTKENELYLEEITEVILRHWKVNDRVSRPEHRKEIDHTAFLVFIRKI